MVIIALFMVTFALMTGCEKKVDISEAQFEGYTARSFEQTMKIYCKKMIDNVTENDTTANYSCGWKEGWVGKNSLNSDVLLDNEKPMTFILSVKLENDDVMETNRFLFYLIHDVKENKLYPQGAVMNEDGEECTFDLEETRKFLEEIFDEYNYNG